MSSGRVLLALWILAHPTSVLADTETRPGYRRVCEDQPEALQGVPKLRLWRAATKYKSQLKDARAEVQGLRDRLESRSSTVAAALLVASSLPEPLERPEPPGLWEHPPVWLWVGLGVAALGLSFSAGLSVGIAASR